MFRVLAAGLVLLTLAGCTGTDPGPVPTPSAAPTSAPAGPVIGAWHELVYHERLRLTLLVNGGPETGKPDDAPLELWSWDGRSWLLASRDGPRWRNFASVVYDSDRAVIVVHGGLQSRGAHLTDTWEWDGQRWREFDGSAPGGREGAGFAYDPVRKVSVLYGGAGDKDFLGDTWAWNGTQWRRLTDAGPAARAPSMMEFDEARGQLVLYGGHAVSGGPSILGDTWLWDGTSWRLVQAASPPGPRVNGGGVFHKRLGRVLMVAGGGERDTVADIWAWDGRAWTRTADTALPPRQAAGLAYDSHREVVVLTGGLDRAGTRDRYQDVWEWRDTTFQRVYP